MSLSWFPLAFTIFVNIHNVVGLYIGSIRRLKDLRLTSYVVLTHTNSISIC